MFCFIGMFGRAGRDGFLIELEVWILGSGFEYILFDNKMYICFQVVFCLFVIQSKEWFDLVHLKLLKRESGSQILVSNACIERTQTRPRSVE